jgi:hypothetical protein
MNRVIDVLYIQNQKVFLVFSGIIKRPNHWVAGLCRTHGRELRTKFWWENFEKKEHKQVLDVDGKILNGSEKKQDGKLWIGFIWLTIHTSAGLL